MPLWFKILLYRRACPQILLSLTSELLTSRKLKEHNIQLLHRELPVVAFQLFAFIISPYSNFIYWAERVALTGQAANNTFFIFYKQAALTGKGIIPEVNSSFSLGIIF